MKKLTLTLVLLATAAVSAQEQKPAAPPTNPKELDAQTARFVPTPITVDLSKMPANEQQALAKLVEAGKVMDALFLRQVWAGNETLLLTLLKDQRPLGKARLHAFLVNKGPWTRLDHNAPFIPGVPDKPAEANFYPAGASKAEVEKWINSLPKDQKDAASGFFTTIRRDAAGKFVVVPYSLEYQGELQQVAKLLREAADLTQQPTLKSFLQKRADAFFTNDYYASDLAWMELDASIEPTIGPYEVYEDEWFNYKAAFESFITVRDDAETAKLQKFSSELQDIENHLPIDPKLRNPKIGALAPIRVVNEVFCSGDGNKAVQTAAYNLPNDERIAKEKGTKRTMLKNVQEAKFSRVLMPITKVALNASDRKLVAFDAFFTHILMHELMHGLGPHTLTINGQQTTVRQQLQETYSALEEAKADISGLFALQYLIDKGVLEKQMEKTMYVTFLASSFRSIRFGLAEAHGKGIALQLNTLLDKGAFKVNKDGTFTVDATKVKDAVRELTTELMMIQANGDKAKALALLKERAVIRPEVQTVLNRLKNVPVDIEPQFVTADKLLQAQQK